MWDGISPMLHTTTESWISSTTVCQVDISTAFLQSNKYGPDEPAKYLVFKNPLTGEKEYYRQLGPIYGENSAPVRWLNTIVPWMTGEERNEKGEIDMESDGHVFEQGIKKYF